MGTPAGWYPDPERPGAQRWWDGQYWTDQIATTSSSRNWAVLAHLSSLIGLVIGFTFMGPLVVYLAKKDDPYVRAHAAESLNFQLSTLIYALVGGLILAVLIIVLVGLILIPLAIAAAIAWLVLVIIAAVRAGNGELYRYPLTIRFVN